MPMQQQMWSFLSLFHKKTPFFKSRHKVLVRKKATHSLIDNVVKKLLVLTSKILNDFSPAGISGEVSKVVLV